MKCRSVTLVRCGFVLTVAALSCTAGCKSVSGWKMPSLFASREPDADKLAGRVETPTSPAEKYTPSAIASKSPTNTTTNTQTAGGLTSGTTSKNRYETTAPKGGLAAQSNGYQTGPYTTNTNLANTTNTGSASGIQAPVGSSNSLVSTPVGSNSSPGFVSPYGGTYSGIGSTSTPNVTPAAGQLPLNSTPNSTALGGAPTGYGIPPYGSNPALGTAPVSASASVPDYPSFQSSNVSSSNTLPMNASVGAVPAYPSTNPPLTSATAVATPESVGVAPAASAYQSALPAGPYAPGTTGRSTNYNFGPPPASTTTIAPAQNRALPPNTASGQQLLIR
jgi:hypothetical protein